MFSKVKLLRSEFPKVVAFIGIFALFVVSMGFISVDAAVDTTVTINTGTVMQSIDAIGNQHNAWHIYYPRCTWSEYLPGNNDTNIALQRYLKI